LFKGNDVLEMLEKIENPEVVHGVRRCDTVAALRSDVGLY